MWWWWWLDVVVVVGCGGGGLMWLWSSVERMWLRMLPWELFGYFGVTRPLPSVNGTYLPNVYEILALVA